jgi:hypothetical protein
MRAGLIPKEQIPDGDGVVVEHLPRCDIPAQVLGTKPCQPGQNHGGNDQRRAERDANLPAGF